MDFSLIKIQIHSNLYTFYWGYGCVERSQRLFIVILISVLTMQNIGKRFVQYYSLNSLESFDKWINVGYKIVRVHIGPQFQNQTLEKLLNNDILFTKTTHITILDQVMVQHELIL
jgi:hypothetical protein